MVRPKVSIIVPVYNTQKTLQECMNSLLVQTLKEIEIVLVNDGSTDDSGRMCDTYACDSRVKVIHKTNGGLSSARNAGIDIVTGEYVGFVDSDDYVDSFMFEKMYEKVTSLSADICLCSHYTVDEHGKTKEHFFQNLPENLENQLIKEKLILPLIGKNWKKNDTEIEGFVCRNLYKREIIESNRFLSERDFFAEDVVFNLTVYAQCKSVCVLNECLYYYRYNESSLSNKYRKDVDVLLENLLNWEWNYMQKNNVPEEEYCRLYATGIKFILFSIRNLQKHTCLLTGKEKKTKVKQILRSPMFNSCIKKVKMQGYNWKAKSFILLCKLNFSEILLRI